MLQQPKAKPQDAGKSAKKKKKAGPKRTRNACEGCFKSRVKCEYTSPDGLRCVRCIRQNRECIPRLVLRGKPKSENAKVGLSELDINAYRSAAIFEEHPHLSLHLSAASSLVKTYKSLGLDKPPTSLKWTINSMFLIATIEKSLGLLHTSTTLAVSTGTPIDVSVLNAQHSPLTEEMKDVYEHEINENFVRNDKAGACFIVRVDVGDRAVLANAQFEYFFEGADSMASRLSESPHFRVWRKFLLHSEDADLFTSKMVKAWLQSGEPSGNPPAIRWTCADQRETKIRDSKNNVYSATLFEYGLLAGEGFLSFHVFGFKNIKALSPDGERRIQQFKMEHSRLASTRVPAVSRFDSAWSVMLPEPTTAPVGPYMNRQALPPQTVPYGPLARSVADAPAVTNGALPAVAIGSQPAVAIGAPPQVPISGQPVQPSTIAIAGAIPPFGTATGSSTNGTQPAAQEGEVPYSPEVSHESKPAPSAHPTSLPRGSSSDSQSGNGTPLVPVGDDTASQGVHSFSSFDWDDSLVKLDSDDFWNSMDMVIDHVGGAEELKNGNWSH